MAQWQWKKDLRFKSKEEAWENYGAAANKKIETAYRQKKTFKLDKTYTIDFKDMVQHRTDDRYRQRDIRRQAAPVQWLFKKDLRLKASNSAAWEPYDDDDVKKIETGFKANKKDDAFVLNSTYMISFPELIQYRKSDRDRQRPIQRQGDDLSDDEKEEKEAEAEAEEETAAAEEEEEGEEEGEEEQPEKKKQKVSAVTDADAGDDEDENDDNAEEAERQKAWKNLEDKSPTDKSEAKKDFEAKVRAAITPAIVETTKQEAKKMQPFAQLCLEVHVDGLDQISLMCYCSKEESDDLFGEDETLTLFDDFEVNADTEALEEAGVDTFETAAAVISQWFYEDVWPGVDKSNITKAVISIHDTDERMDLFDGKYKPFD